MGRILKFTAIGCGGLIALVVVFGIIGAIVGSDSTPTKPSGANKQPSPPAKAKPEQTQQKNEVAKKPLPEKALAKKPEKKAPPKTESGVQAQKATPKKPKTLINFSGSGIRNSPPFQVDDGPVTINYAYDCSSFGQEGNFIAQMVSGNPSSLDSDFQQIANDLGRGGGQTTTVYPATPGKPYHLEVNSTCSWSIKATQ